MKIRKIDIIVESLIDSTEIGETQWTVKSSIFDTDIKKSLTTRIDDNTKIDVVIERDEKGSIVTNGLITIYNKEIAGGLKVFTCEKVKSLQIILNSKYGDIIKTDMTEKVLSDIIDKIGKENIRNTKLEALLNKNKNFKEYKILNKLTNIFK